MDAPDAIKMLHCPMKEPPEALINFHATFSQSNGDFGMASLLILIKQGSCGCYDTEQSETENGKGFDGRGYSYCAD